MTKSAKGTEIKALIALLQVF